MHAMSQRAYARHRGVTHRAVQKALATGRIQADADGRIDPDTADAMWLANTRPALRPGSIPRKTRVAFLKAKADRERCRAELARLQYGRRIGQLLDVAVVEAACFTATRRARDALLALPNRLAPVLTGISDTESCRAILAEEVARICDQLETDQARITESAAR